MQVTIILTSTQVRPVTAVYSISVSAQWITLERVQCVNPSNLSEIRSSDPVLTSLSVSAGTLTPTFIGDTCELHRTGCPIFQSNPHYHRHARGPACDGPYFYGTFPNKVLAGRPGRGQHDPMATRYPSP